MSKLVRVAWLASPPLAAEPSTVGSEHWVAFMENLDQSMNGPPSFVLYIAAPGATTDVLGRVE